MTTLDFVHEYVPSTESKDATTLLLLHGTGGNEHDLIPLGRALLPGAALLSPRGKILENGMPRFFRRLAEGVFDIDDLKHRTHELAEFIQAARRYYHLSGKIIAAGYSNGANIAASMMMLHPEILAGAVLFRAMVPFVPDAPADLRRVGVLLAAGERDPIASPDQTRQLKGILEQAGADVSLHWHDGGHELGHDDLQAAQAWITSRKFA